MVKLLVDISGHGFGHAAMTLPVLDRLYRRRADVQLTIRSGLEYGWIKARLGAPFTLLDEPHEFGMRMVDSIRVLPLESVDAYNALHADWDRLIEAEAEKITRLSPDLVLSNISYVALAGAAKAGVRSVAYSSLNWADVFMAYCADLPGANAIHSRMVAAYGYAEVFIRPEPSMPMPSICNGLDVGPVARLGHSDRARLRHAVGAADSDRVCKAASNRDP